MTEESHPNEVTFVIGRSIKSGFEKEYDDWLRRYLATERNVPGYLGTTIIMPGGDHSAIRYIIQRYADKASMSVRKNSQESLKLIEEANNYSMPHYESATGMETWFTLPDLKDIVPPPKWKMAIIVFMAAYCISSLSRYFLNPYLGLQPVLFNLFMTIILVIGLTYFAMPLLSRLLRRWLYRPIQHSQ
jgi:antibiotic biosynthesis monooxygenase (ABM) superfamily enzyme